MIGVVEMVRVSQVGGRWAIQHEDGVLGHLRSRDEAERVGADLVEWLRSRGRRAELLVDEPRSFAPGRKRYDSA